jgi:O-antigen/teichoic acid export membrane protein
MSAAQPAIAPPPVEEAPAPGSFRRLTAVFAQYGVVVVGLGIARIFNFAGAILLAHELSVRAFGAFSVGYAFAMLVGQLPSVFDLSFVRNFGNARTDAERTAVERGHLQLKLLSTAVMVGLAVIAAGPIASHVFGRETLTSVIRFAMLDGAMFSLFATGPASFQGRGKFGRYAGLYAVEGIVGAAAVLAYVMLVDATATGGMTAYLLVDGALALGTCVILGRRLLPLRSVRAGDSQLMGLVRFSGWLGLGNIAYLLTQRIDVLLLAGFASLFVLGQYGAAIRLIAVVSLFTGNLAAVFVTKASRLGTSRHEIREYLVHAGAATAGIGVIVIGAIALASPIVHVVLGPDYAAAVGPLRLLLIAYGMVALSSPMTSLLIGVGKPRLVFVQRVLELGSALAAGLVLIPRYEATGAALCLLIGYGAGAAFATLNAYRLATPGRPG